MIGRRQTRDKLAGAVIADFVVVVTREDISKIIFLKEAKDLNMRALPFKILPCASTVSGDIV